MKNPPLLTILVVSVIITIGIIALWVPFKEDRENRYATATVETLPSSEQMRRVQAVTFYRVSDVTYSFTHAGNYTFRDAVYLVGFNAVTCKSEPQEFEIFILSENIQDWYEVMKPNASGYNPTGHTMKVYFWGSLSSNGQDQQTIMFPPNIGFFVPEGGILHFQIFAPRVGTGGHFTIYYVEAEV